MSPVLGIIASSTQQGRGVAVGSYDSLATITVPSGGLASVVFAGIPTGYQHLEISGIVRSTASVTDGNTNMRFNADSGSNYNGHYLFGNGSGTASGGGGAGTAIDTIRLTGASSTANMFGSGTISILNYSNSTRFKTTKTLGSNNQNGLGLIILFSGLWLNTSPITSITLTPSSGSFAEYTQFALYGVK